MQAGEVMLAEGGMQVEAVAEVVISILRTQLKYLVTDIIYDNEDSNFYFPPMDLLIVYNDLFLYIPTHLYNLHIQQAIYCTYYNTITLRHNIQHYTTINKYYRICYNTIRIFYVFFHCDF